MRVLLDTSVLISYLRSTSPGTSAAGAILRTALAGGFTLLLVEGVVDELVQTITERPDLGARIPHPNVTALIDELRSISERVERLDEPYPAVGRDRDDYVLVAHAVFADADWLVSWDNDLLVLDPIDHLRIGNPPTFLAALRASGIR